MRPQSPYNIEAWYPASNTGGGGCFDIGKNVIYSTVDKKNNSPSKFFIYSDSVNENASGRSSQTMVFFLLIAADTHKIHARHGNKANLWFADGAVKSQSPSDIVNDCGAAIERISVFPAGL